MKLPIGIQQPNFFSANRRSLASYRQAARAGVTVLVEILPGPGCPLAEAQAGMTYSLDSVPSIPFLGCVRELGCGCCYSPVVIDE